MKEGQLHAAGSLRQLKSPARWVRQQAEDYCQGGSVEPRRCFLELDDKPERTQTVIAALNTRPYVIALLATSQWSSLVDRVGGLPGNAWPGLQVRTQLQLDAAVAQLMAYNGRRKFLQLIPAEPMLLPLEPRYRRSIGMIVLGTADIFDPVRTHPAWYEALADQCDYLRWPAAFVGWGLWAPDCDRSVTYRRHRVASQLPDIAVADLRRQPERLMDRRSPLRRQLLPSALFTVGVRRKLRSQPRMSLATWFEGGW